MAITLEQAAAATREIESGGRYTARGPVVKSGRYAGQQAAGAYQVMPGNIPSWTQAALGRSYSTEEFLASTSAQDAVYAHQFNQNVSKFGSAEDAASIWHSGSTLEQAKRRGATDGYMRTEDYVNRFKSLATGSAPLPKTASNSLGTAQASVNSAMQMRQNRFVEDMNALAALRTQAKTNGNRFDAIQTPATPSRSLLNSQVLQGAQF